MKIKTPLVVAIEFKNEKEFMEALQIAKYQFSKENEDFRYCVLRERGKEALTCIESKIPFIAYDVKEHEPIFANVDVSSLPSDTKLFIRKSSDRYPEKLGFDFLFSQEDENFLEQWPKFIESDCPYTKRSITYIPHDTFANMLENDAIMLPAFIKTANKGINQQYTLHHVIDEKSINLFNAERINSIFDYESTDSRVTFLFEGQRYFNEWVGEWERGHSTTHSLKGDFIVSDVMSIENDELSDNGKVEYRCYVINDKLANMSRYVDYKHIEIPNDAKVFAKSFIEAYKGNIASAYVLDIAKTDKGYQLVEINPLPNSGRYLNNIPNQIYNLLLNEFADNKAIIVLNDKIDIERPPKEDDEPEFTFD